MPIKNVYKDSQNNIHKEKKNENQNNIIIENQIIQNEKDFQKFDSSSKNFRFRLN